MLCCPGLKRFLFALAFIGLIGGASMAIVNSPATASPADEKAKDVKMLRHVVMFKFKDSSSKEDIQGVVDAFRKLPSKIPTIADFEYGTNNSPEGLADGFTHCFLVSFKSEKDREVYLPHEAHKAFVEVLKPHLDKVMVIDYWAGK
ncbi:MAG: Dabb family protein [Aureliella sp.]